MSRSHYSRCLVATLAIALLVALSAPAAFAQDEEERQETRIHIVKKGDGDGEEVERHHKIVFIGDDGDVSEFHGEGDGYHWMAGPHGKKMHFGFGDFGPGAFLGVATTELTAELRRHFGVSEDQGVMVSKVVDDSGAFRAGVLVGDIITAVDGDGIDSGHDLRRAIRQHDEGDAVTIEIWRDGQAETVSAVLGQTDGAIGGHGMPHVRAMTIDCDDDAGDCDISMSHQTDACGDAEECEVKISCDDGDCSCEVNGEPADCEEIGAVRLHDD